ncbi:alpha-L-fucosidase [Microbulbifer sp. 2304DJ12-6]|uniref:alpha-L-fucosidase n=1 Tax=Microbulbifer sp. 2304DJ12-6 TaxID=3233340 RepID=UPI0039B10CA4
MRNLGCLLLGMLLGASALAYDPVEEGETEAWYEDAKLGIFIHWGLYSVPGYAPVEHYPDVSRSFLEEVWEFIKNGGEVESAYAEWYLHNLKKEGGKTEHYHRAQFGQDFDYYNFAKTFNQAVQQWQPQSWASLFEQVGARYVVLVSKHHDGFTLWPSQYPSANIPRENARASRDIVGELSEAVRNAGLHMGLYFSGGIDWSYNASYDFTPLGWHAYPEDFIHNTDNQLEELVERYQPDILWNDISYPEGSRVVDIIHRYRQQRPHAVINNRWRDISRAEIKPDFATPEYATYADIQPFKWETSRGLGYSYGYNQLDSEQTTISRKALIHFLVDVVSKNGNLLLNIGPKADGTIPDIQLDRLKGLGEWMAVNSEAIYKTRPWIRAEGKTKEGGDVRYTATDDALYATLLSAPSAERVTLLDTPVGKIGTVSLLGFEGELDWQHQDGNITFHWPETAANAHAYVIKISRSASFVQSR